MKFGLRWARLAGVGALSLALLLPAQAEGQRRDEDDRERETVIRLRDLEGRAADLALMAGRMRIGRAMLGISIEDDEAGARIVSLREDGPADEAGLEEDDVIVALNGAELSEAVEEEGEGDEWGPTRRLIHLMADVDPDDTVRVDYLREGRRASVDVTATERSAWGVYQSGAPFFSYARSLNPRGSLVFGVGGFQGAHLASVNEGLGSYFGVQSGALVLDVDDDEDTLGLRPGDVIVEIGGRDVEDASDAYRILGSYEPGERLRVVVVREGSRVTLEGAAD